MESKHRHDWVECRCGNVFVDGGQAYIRRGYEEPECVEETSLFTDDEQDADVNTGGDQWTTAGTFE